MWSPLVTTAAPARMRLMAIFGVMPRPPAEFSPFTTMKSSLSSSLSSGSSTETALRPGSPTTSPKKRRRKSPSVLSAVLSFIVAAT
jgi:hypothetical protein